MPTHVTWVDSHPKEALHMMKPNGIHIESKMMNTIEHIDGRGGTSVGPHLPASCIMHGVLLDSIATQAGAALTDYHL